MRSTKMDNDNRVAKIGIEQERGADDINRKELNAQYINTFYLQDKMDWVNMPNWTTNEELEHGRDQKNITEMMCGLLRKQAAPELEIDIFDGNPIDFHYSMAVFK